MQNIKTKIVKNLQSASTCTLVLGISYTILFILSIILITNFDNLVESIKDEVSETFRELLLNMKNADVVLLYLLVLLLILPFGIATFIETFKTNKLIRHFEEIDLNTYINILKSFIVSIALGLADTIGFIIAYLVLGIGNIWVLLIPLSLIVPLYILICIFRGMSLKLAGIERKKKSN